jgi:hypothetical protein
MGMSLGPLLAEYCARAAAGLGVVREVRVGWLAACRPVSQSRCRCSVSVTHGVGAPLGGLMCEARSDMCRAWRCGMAVQPLAVSGWLACWVRAGWCGGVRAAPAASVAVRCQTCWWLYACIHVALGCQRQSSSTRIRGCCWCMSLQKGRWGGEWVAGKMSHRLYSNFGASSRQGSIGLVWGGSCQPALHGSRCSSVEGMARGM